MKPFSSGALFLPRNPNPRQPSLFLRTYHFSTASGGNTFSNPPRRRDEDTRNVRVAVWWDFENCNIPTGVNELKVAPTITAAIRANGMKGPVQITAFGDVLQLSRARQLALTSTGVNIIHIPNGGKNSADKSLLVDLLYWVSQNPPPAHLFLISGDRDFASILHRLRMSNYNILLASRDSGSSVLCSAASIMWHWPSLVKGADLNGKHYNQPPDGPYSSWYGHYKVPLEDPFAIDQQQQQTALPKAKDIPPEPCLEPKVRLIPRTTVRHVRHVLKLYPEGILLTELQKELVKYGITEDYFGYKRFSHFLAALPHIVKLQAQSDGTCLVLPVISKSAEPSEYCMDISAGDAETEELGRSKCLKVEVAEKYDFVNGNEKEASSKSPQYPITEGKPRKVKVIASVGQNGENSLQDVLEPALKKSIAEGFDTQVIGIQDSKSEQGFFKRGWKRWFGFSDNLLDEKCHDIPKPVSVVAPEQCGSSEDQSDKKKGMQNILNSNDANANIANLGLLASPADESALKEQASAGFERCDKSSMNTTFFQKIVKRCTFWKTSTEVELLSHQQDENVDEESNHSTWNDVFSQDTFWSDMKSFLDSPRGSVLVHQSTTRAEMAEKLQKTGPEALRTLSEKDLFHLVDLLIVERKLVEEHPSHTFPFKVLQPNCSKGLRDIFSSNHDTERKYQNIPHAGISPPPVKKRGSERSREQVLADCKNIVNELLSKYPEGYNIGLFRKAFLEKYGYPLDLQMLGYQKLSALLQIFPGVAIESTYIVSSPSRSPATILEAILDVNTDTSTSLSDSNSDSELSDSSLKKDDSFDFQWEELGPVADSNSKRESADYEPVILDDESSDSEDESRLTVHGGVGKQSNGSDKELSSLFQVLNSWSSNEGHKNRKSNDTVNSPSGSRKRLKYSFVAADPGRRTKRETDA